MKAEHGSFHLSVSYTYFIHVLADERPCFGSVSEYGQYTLVINRGLQALRDSESEIVLKFTKASHPNCTRLVISASAGNPDRKINSDQDKLI